MWHSLSLRARLNVILALVLAAGLAANIGRLLLDAGPRVQDEDRNAMALARQLVETFAADLGDSPDPEARIARMTETLAQVRHVSVTWSRDGAPSAPPGDKAAESSAPRWFVALVTPEQQSQKIPLTAQGRALGVIVIASRPADEIAEIWDDMATQIVIGGLLALILFVITMIVVRRALVPLDRIGDAMARIEAGRFDTRVDPAGSPDFAAICARLNHLAETLGLAIEDRRQLAARVVSLQDDERTEIARELHDEFGPYLFALRAHASSLARAAEPAAPDMDAIRRHGRTIAEQLTSLQQVNRRVLERLRPPGLADLGLSDAISSLVRLWTDAHPDVSITQSVRATLTGLGDTLSLTLYRLVQEALTNVFRHAGATQVDIAIDSVGEAGGSLRLRVRDNGEGLAADHRSGFGMAGMRERVMALGGRIHVDSLGRGVLVEAVLPMQA